VLQKVRTAIEGGGSNRDRSPILISLTTVLQLVKSRELLLYIEEAENQASVHVKSSLTSKTLERMDHHPASASLSRFRTIATSRAVVLHNHLTHVIADEYFFVLCTWYESIRAFFR
jgi:hypothetical protein